MIIIVPSRERAQSAQTLTRSIPRNWRGKTRILVNEAEQAAYVAAHPDYTVWTHRENTIVGVRQAALDMADDDSVFLIDDDLQFYVRRQYDPPRLRDATDEDMEQLFAATGALLGPELPLISVSFRQHNDATLPPFTFNGRSDRAYAFHKPTLQKLGIRYEIDFLENFHLALSVLLAGYPNMIWWHWAQGQPESNSPGGCSTYRTAERQAASVRALAARHPGFVQIVHGKKTKTGWEGVGERDDVVCSWGEAFAAGYRRRGAAPPEIDVSRWIPKGLWDGGQPGLF